MLIFLTACCLSAGRLLVPTSQVLSDSGLSVRLLFSCLTSMIHVHTCVICAYFIFDSVCIIITSDLSVPRTCIDSCLDLRASKNGAIKWPRVFCPCKNYTRLMVHVQLLIVYLRKLGAGKEMIGYIFLAE